MKKEERQKDRNAEKKKDRDKHTERKKYWNKILFYPSSQNPDDYHHFLGLIGSIDLLKSKIEHCKLTT